MTRYSNIEFVLELDIDDGVNLINKIYEKKNDELLEKRWIATYQETMSLTEFKEKLMQLPIESKSKEEIMEDVNSILEDFKSKGIRK